LLLLPDALTTSLGHRAGCRLHLVSPTASEPISPAAAGGDGVAGWGLGVKHGPPAFRLRAHMSIAARGLWLRLAWKQRGRSGAESAGRWGLGPASSKGFILYSSTPCKFVMLPVVPRC